METSMKYKKKSTALRTASLATLACLAAGEASAQAVQVYGLVGLFVGSVQRSGEEHGTRELGPGGLNTSFLGFRVRKISATG
jgi:predicted porin